MKTLYVRTGCGFCGRVLAYIEEQKISLEIKNVADGNNLEELVTLGGKSQVPFLIDTDKGVSMYESGAIIEYLNKENSILPR